MKRPLIAVLIASLYLASISQQASPQPISGREKLGGRIAYTHSASDIKNTYGDGTALTLHFTERIKPPVFIDIAIGAIYLGGSAVDSIKKYIPHTDISDASMRILFLNIAPVFEFPVTEGALLYASAGIGLYSISVILERVFLGLETSQEHFGANIGLGLYYPLSDKWKLDFNFSAQRIWTDANLSDMFYFYSEGDSDPDFYLFSVGVCIALN